jgi:hypothetical protein
MSEHIYKTSELVGSSTKGIQDAIEQAVIRAHKTIRNMRWFEVDEVRGNIDKGKVQYWQVRVRVGFTLEE